MTRTKTRAQANWPNNAISVLDFGAVGDGVTDDTAAIQAAVSASKSVIFPKGSYQISSAINLTLDGCYLQGQDAVINQTVYPEIGFYVQCNNATIKGFEINGVPTKTQLSTVISTRFNGDVQRTKSSAVYLYNRSGLTVSSCSFNNFINGIYFKGGADSNWVTNDGSNAGRMTTNTFVLNAADQRGADYWVGGFIRILTNSGSTNVCKIQAYNNSTNTVTFALPQTVITLSGGDQWNYSIEVGQSNDVRISDCYIDGIDFGYIGSNVSKLDIHNCVANVIEQTQETNARPHTVYFVGGNNTDFTASNLVTYSCEQGYAYKFVSVNNLTLNDLVAYKSRGCAQIEACIDVVTNGLTSFDTGFSNDSTPVGLDCAASKNVTATNTRFYLSTNYTLTAADQRPKGISVIGSDDVQRGDLGTMLANAPIQCESIHVDSLTMVIPAAYTGAPSGVYSLGTATRPVINSIFSGMMFTGGSLTTDTHLVRLNYTEDCLINQFGNIKAISAAKVILDASTENNTISLSPEQANLDITDSGTNNIIITAAPFKKGRWTPVIKGSTTEGTNTYSAQLGDWSVAGDQVLVTGRISLTALNSVGNITIAGLPFPSDNFDESAGAGYQQSGVLANYSNVSFTALPMLNLERDSTELSLTQQTVTGVTDVTEGNLSATTNLFFSFVYKGKDIYG